MMITPGLLDTVRRLMPKRCPQCAQHFKARPIALIFSFETVARRIDKSAEAVARDYFAEYHRRQEHP